MARKVDPENSLAARYPEVAAQWHPTRNGGLGPEDVSYGVGKKVWWKCLKGSDHEWQVSPNERTSTITGCPFCAGKRVSVTNSLTTLFPELAAQWHPTKNNALNPDQIYVGSTKKVWWKCNKGPDHEWQESPNLRQKLGCPFCAGRRVSVTNALEFVYPDIAAEWHPTKNGSLTPEKVVAGSHKKVWWKCLGGPDHEWRAALSNRTGTSKRGCPFCAGQKVSVTNSLATRYPEVAAQWHPTRNGRLRPEDLAGRSGKKVWWVCSKGPDHKWRETVCNRTRQNLGCPFCSNHRLSITNSLSIRYPDVAAEWHPVKNGDLTPKDIVAGSNKRVWWKCPKGSDHEWPAYIYSRSEAGAGCPFCAGQKPSITNSLATLFPEIAKEWHPIKNGSLTPEKVVAGSHKKVWWKCLGGPDHEWRAALSKRTGTSKRGCPYCVGQKVSVTNSLATRFPGIAAQWHPKKNDDLTPDKIVAGSGKKAWWKCDKGSDHEWRASLGNRTRAGRGCPFCAGKLVSVTNSLASQFPEIASQWHPIKNRNFTPEMVVAGSSKMVWWKCSKGPDHEWRAVIGSRTGSRKVGCPCCSGKKVSVTNSLATMFPVIAAKWHPIKNGKLTPDMIVAKSNKSVWWKCNNGPDHDWKEQPNSRVISDPYSCPFCSGRRLSVTNSLATKYPEIAKEWHPTKNGKFRPKDIIAGSDRKVWWKCPDGPDHEWRSNLYSRTGPMETGCPCCASQKISITNCLATLFPEVAAEWHPTKNGKLTPDKVIAGSEKKYWWRCHTNPDHEWDAMPASRTRLSSGCPNCTLTPRSKPEIFLTFELSHFFDFDPAEHKLRLGSRVRDIDILIPSLKLIVEYDGARWHREKIDADRAKTARLTDAGWTVVRVREAPLEPLGPYDLVVPTNTKPKAMADAVLHHLAALGYEVEGLARYLRRKTLVRVREAEAYIEALLREKAARDGAPVQTTLPAAA